MAGVLLVYATTHGHTAKIARRIAETLSGEGLSVELVRVEESGHSDPSRHDGVIVAASLHGGHHQRPVAAWVRDHLAELEGRPSAFVSVSLTAAEDTADAREATQRCIEEFLEETGWRPWRAIPVAGSLQYREYDVFTRVLMRLMMRRGGHTTDVSRDHEYTNWDELDRSVREFAAYLGSPG